MYDTAKRLADGAVRQNKVTIQNVREVLERGGGIIKPKSNQVCICTEKSLSAIPEEHSRNLSASDSGNKETACCNTSQQRQHRGARHIMYLPAVVQ